MNEFAIIFDTKEEFVERLLAEALQQAGMNLWNESTKDTPKRIAKMWLKEMNMKEDPVSLEELKSNMTTFPNENMTCHPVVVEGEFTSFCEHHLLPFYGKFKVTYAPKYSIIGLSKIPRAVEYFSSRPQLQERLAKDIGDFLYDVLEPYSLRVELFDVVHTCVKCRGVKSDTKTNTLYTRRG